MAVDRPTFTVDITGPAPLGDDLRAAISGLPEDVKLALAPITQRVLEARLALVDRIDGRMVSRPTALFVAFAAFIDRLADETEATKD